MTFSLKTFTVYVHDFIDSILLHSVSNQMIRNGFWGPRSNQYSVMCYVPSKCPSPPFTKKSRSYFSILHHKTPIFDSITFSSWLSHPKTCIINKWAAFGTEITHFKICYIWSSNVDMSPTSLRWRLSPKDTIGFVISLVISLVIRIITKCLFFFNHPKYFRKYSQLRTRNACFIMCTTFSNYFRIISEFFLAFQLEKNIE